MEWSKMRVLRSLQDFLLDVHDELKRKEKGIELVLEKDKATIIGKDYIVEIKNRESKHLHLASSKE